jgi:hypothetical protein
MTPVVGRVVDPPISCPLYPPLRPDITPACPTLPGMGWGAGHEKQGLWVNDPFCDCNLPPDLRPLRCREGQKARMDDKMGGTNVPPTSFRPFTRQRVEYRPRRDQAAGNLTRYGELGRQSAKTTRVWGISPFCTTQPVSPAAKV